MAWTTRTSGEGFSKVRKLTCSSTFFRFGFQPGVVMPHTGISLPYRMSRRRPAWLPPTTANTFLQPESLLELARSDLVLAVQASLKASFSFAGKERIISLSAS